jgi:PAS domain S-box-containing protein
VADQLDDAFFRALFHSQLGGIAVADLETACLIDINEVLLEILGRSRDEIVDIPHVWLEMTPPEYHELDQRGMQQVLERGHSDPFEKEYLRPDGSRVPVRISSAVVSGYPGKLIVFVSDISDERAARAREQSIQQRLEIAISAADQGVWDWDLVTNEMVYSERAKQIYGLPPGEPVTLDKVRAATHQEDIKYTLPLLERALDPAIRDRSSYEYRVVWPNGEERWVLAYGEAVFAGPPGAEKAIRYVGTIQDINARKTAERQQQIMVAELNHRVKNMLAVVQALAFQTMRGEAVPEHVSEAFSGRLKALSSAHEILTRESWEGADLQDIAVGALTPLAADLPKRVSISGDSIRMRPQAAVSLSMALHELATNASKYGALSNDGGHVDLSWVIDSGPEPMLRLTWKENDGPPVAAPAGQGFGTRMIKRVVASDMGGDVEMQFDAKGLSCTVSAPLRTIAA